MCEKCAAFDDRLVRMKALSARETDEFVLQGLELLIKQYALQKHQIHAERAVRRI